MAINVLRFQSNVFVDVVNEIKMTNPMCVNAKYTDRLVKMLEQNEQLPEVVWDVPAVDAVKKNNEQAVTMQQVPFGNNKATLTKLVGIQIPSEEFTMTGFPVTGPTAGVAFVALQMILDFDRCGSSPLLKPDVTRVGISCKDS